MENIRYIRGVVLTLSMLTSTLSRLTLTLIALILTLTEPTLTVAVATLTFLVLWKLTYAITRSHKKTTTCYQVVVPNN